VKIYTPDGNDYHLNDYHFIYRYQYVNSGNIGESSKPHAVLLKEFDDWIGLAAAAGNAAKSVFKFDGLQWEIQSGEIYPTDQASTVLLTKAEIESLALYFNDDTEPPQNVKTPNFNTAWSALKPLKRQPVTAVLRIQWPERLPPGIGNDKTNMQSTSRDRYIWGVGGSLEYPHIHCFLKGGYLTEARATISPAPQMEKKRGFVFQSDLKVVRTDAQPADDAVLDELERVMRCLATGAELTMPTVATGKKTKEEVAPAAAVVAKVVYDPLIVAYAEEKEVPVAWVHDAAVALGLSPDDVSGFPRELLVEEAATVNVVLKTADTGRGRKGDKRKNK